MLIGADILQNVLFQKFPNVYKKNALKITDLQAHALWASRSAILKWIMHRAEEVNACFVIIIKIYKVNGN